MVSEDHSIATTLYLPVAVQLMLRSLSLFGITLFLCTNSHGQTERHTHPTHHDFSTIHAYTYSWSAGWDSRYVLEGRNVLEKGGLGSVTFEWNRYSPDNQEIAITGWYAEGTDTAYSELNLGIGYAWHFSTVDIGVGYTWLDFVRDDLTDREFSLDFSNTIFGDLEAGIALVYSTAADGSFIELEVVQTFERESFTWSPYLMLGINGGYVSGEHEGLNHLQMGVEFMAPLFSTIETGVYLAYTIGLKEEPGETLEDILWFGMNISWVN